MSRTVLIHGAGVEAWAAGLYVKRKLGALVDDVRVVDGDGQGRNGPAATIIPPIVRPFLEALGISEEDLFRKANASFLLGADIKGASSFIRAWSRYGAPANGVGFHHFWKRMADAGFAAPFDHYSFGAELARAGRFIHPAPDPKKIESSFDYGYTLDTEAFGALLRSRALAAGVEAIAGQQSVERPWLTLDLRETGGGDWTAWPDLPDRFSLADAPVEETSGNQSIHEISAERDGVSLLLRPRTMTVRRSVAFGAQEAIESGRRECPWGGRTVAMGPGAFRMPALNGAGMMLLHAHLDLLSTLLPADGAPIEPLAGEYNRRANRMTDHAADFEAFSLAALSGPSRFSFSSPSLARKVEQFRSRGRLVTYDDELHTEQDWITTFIGAGLVPVRVSPLALGAPVEEVHHSYERLRQAIARAASQLPQQRVYLDHLLNVKEGAPDAV